MARTPNASKHPALMMHSQNGLEKVSKETGKGKISDLPYWKDLSGPEQVFLSNYLFYRDAALAAKIQGKELRESTLSLGDTPWFSNGASTMNNIFIQPFDARQEPENVIDVKVVEG